MTWATISSFALMAALLIMTPGPNGVLIARTVPSSGVAAGFANIAGFAAAFFMHGAFAIFGLSLIVLRSANLFLAVKWIGACYLIWIGIKALRDALRGLPAKVPSVGLPRSRRTLLKAFAEGFVTNALNPKVAMFYLAAFPQFVPLTSVSPASAFLLVAIHAALNFVWFGLIILLFNRLAGVTRGGKVQRYLKAMTGFLFVGFGLKLATMRP